MGKLQDDNFITIYGWMINDLHLKGNDLLVYAVIYSFKEQGYNQGLQKLMDWTSTDKTTVLRALKNLENKKHIKKSYEHKGGVRYANYQSQKNTGGKMQLVVKRKNTGGKMQLNNYINNTLLNNNVEFAENSKKDTGKERGEVKAIIDYLNSKRGTRYRSNTEKTQALIHARKAEGFSLEDFQKVIDNKVADWQGTEWQKFLRPETLFGPKFEGYLNQQPRKNKTEEQPTVSFYRPEDNIDDLF